MLVARYKTKKALKDAVMQPDCLCHMASNPSTMLTVGAVLADHRPSRHQFRFEETSIFGNECKPGGTFAVVGPGAYQRKWYAQVTIDKNYNVIKVK